MIRAYFGFRHYDLAHRNSIKKFVIHGKLRNKIWTLGGSLTKIAFFGNVANNFFRIATCLVEDRTLSITLLLPDTGDTTNFPMSDLGNPSAIDQPWIFMSKECRLRYLFRLDNSSLIKRLRQYDLVFLSSWNVIAAPFLKKKAAVFFPTGADLTIFPFFARYLRLNLQSAGYWKTFRPDKFFKIFLVSSLIKFGIRRCDFVLSDYAEPYQDALSRLRIKENKILRVSPPLAIDTDTFVDRPISKMTLPAHLINSIQHYDFVVFSPSRILTKKSRIHTVSGQYKGNDIFIRSFEKYLKLMVNRRNSSLLLLIDRGTSAKHETNKMKRLIYKLGIEDSVLWLIPEDGESFSRVQLIDLFSLSSVVADDFGAGWFGSISLEALSCSRPVITYVKDETLQRTYPWHPFISSNDENILAEKLFALATSPKQLKYYGAMGRKWVQENHSSEPIKVVYRNIIMQLLDLKNIEH